MPGWWCATPLTSATGLRIDIYTVYIRYFWLGNHQIYGVYIRVYIRFWPTLHIRTRTSDRGLSSRLRLSSGNASKSATLMEPTSLPVASVTPTALCLCVCACAYVIVRVCVCVRVCVMCMCACGYVDIYKGLRKRQESITAAAGSKLSPHINEGECRQMSRTHTHTQL